MFTFIGASTLILLRLCLIVFWKETILFLLIYRLAIYILFYFQFSIQMWWLMMMFYLKFFKMDRELALRDNSKLLEDFDNIKRKLRRIEILLRSWYITYVWIWTFWMLFIIFSQIYSHWFEQFDPNSFCKFTIDFSNVLMYIEEWTQVLFIVTDWVLFYFIIKMMKTNLNHYYRVNKKKWVILAISNLLFFSCSFLNSILINHYHYNIFIVYYQGNWVIISTGDMFSTLEIVLMIVLYILTTLPILSYSYFNIYNIHYWKYLYDLFSGLGIADKFEGISIFITKSWWFKENEQEESESFISITEEEKEHLGFSALNVSSQEDIHVSYQNDTKYIINLNFIDTIMNF